MELINQLTAKCIQCHKNPIVKVNFPVQKFFLMVKTEEDQELVKKSQELLRGLLNQERVEKRSTRILSIWLEKKNIAEVKRVTKNLLKYCGFQNKDGIFLYPEEVLYLLEMNRLELKINKTTLSVQNVYNLILNATNVNLSNYQVYRKLSLLGYKIVRFDQFQHKLSYTKSRAVKRGLESSDYKIPNKRKCQYQPVENDIEIAAIDEQLQEDYNTSDIKNESFTSSEFNYVCRVFEEMRKVMPVNKSNLNIEEKPDYYIFNPKNVNKFEPDFSLFICENNALNHKGINEQPKIFASCVDDVAFYTLNHVNLPFI